MNARVNDNSRSPIYILPKLTSRAPRQLHFDLCCNLCQIFTLCEKKFWPPRASKAKNFFLKSYFFHTLEDIERVIARRVPVHYIFCVVVIYPLHANPVSIYVAIYVKFSYFMKKKFRPPRAFGAKNFFFKSCFFHMLEDIERVIAGLSTGTCYHRGDSCPFVSTRHLVSSVHGHRALTSRVIPHLDAIVEILRGVCEPLFEPCSRLHRPKLLTKMY